MKAKELMIGDWVNVLSHFLETSTEGTTTCGGYHLCRKNCRISGMNGELIAIDKICSEVIAYEPIPLNETMFRLNGIDEGKCSYEFYNGYYVFLDDGKSKCVQVGPIWFVHELQHALRLCGLNELADNFKVR